MNLNKYAKHQYPKLLTHHEKDAIYTYTADHFEINNVLRFNQNISFNLERQIKALDCALKKFQLDESLVVYRNINMIEDSFFDKYINDVMNGSFIDLGYSSCSTIKNLYAQVANVKLQIQLEPYINGAYIKYLSSFKEENEFLLARGTTFETLNYNVEEGVHKIMCKVKK